MRLALAVTGHAYAGYFITPARADALSIGALIAIEGAGRLLPLARKAAPWLGLAVLALTFAGGWKIAIEDELTPTAVAMKSAGLTLLDFTCGALLILLLAPSPPRWLAAPFDNRGIRWIGQISYGVYVFHYLLLPVLRRLFPYAAVREATGSDVAAIAGFVLFGGAVSIAAAALSWHLFEKRVLRLKRHLTYGAT